ncbi:MAG: serpin family protein, partial [Chloroflexi bacterium]|nr:serpin family protein [Chloroflexota bacterium]
ALIKSAVARAPADPSAAAAAAAAIEALTADLYRELGARPGNLLFSPYSVEIALAMARAGASGATRTEMDRVLHSALAPDLDGAMNALDQELAKRPGRYPYGGDRNTTVELELAPANQLFGQRDLGFDAAFLDRLAASYGAGMRLVDYKSAAGRERARADINRWVAERTRDRIPELIKPGVLDELTRLVITNALYFKGKWTTPFTKGATAAAPFHRLDGTTGQAQLMSASFPSGLPYAQAPGWTAAVLSYVGGVSMLVIVPDLGAFTRVDARLREGALLREVTGSLKRDAAVRLRMPKFTFRTHTQLRPTLAALGMPTAFTGRADFSGIIKAERLLIQDVVHEAFIAVDEEGTEAAAATAVLFGLTSAPLRTIELTIDRPFLFAVRDDATGAVLFFGRVVDPA